MQWYFEDDVTQPLIQAHEHIKSSHRQNNVDQLPTCCMIFFLGGAIEYIESHYEVDVLAEKLPVFLGGSRCIKLKDHDHICFVHGGYGSPQAADLVETLYALGVRSILSIGMCGSFSSNRKVGDVFVPHHVYSEEGTSRHYSIKTIFQSNPSLQHRLYHHFLASFPTYDDQILTMDAIYRQTYAKEALWRQMGCYGVDMETSAILCVAQHLQIQAACALLVSDHHPLPQEHSWSWGVVDFKSMKTEFIKQAISFAITMNDTTV